MATKTKAPSRSTKPTTKKRGLFSRVNFSSRKTQFLVSILIIAVAGAGYFTYSSFAASDYTFSATSLKVTGGYPGNKCGWNQSAEAEKNNSTVNTVWCPALGTSLGTSAIDMTTAKIGVPAGNKFAACVSLKGKGKFSISAYGDGTYNRYATKYATGEYTEHCTIFTNSTPSGMGVEGRFSFSAYPDGGLINVSYIKIKQLGPTEHAGAPAK